MLFFSLSISSFYDSIYNIALESRDILDNFAYGFLYIHIGCLECSIKASSGLHNVFGFPMQLKYRRANIINKSGFSYQNMFVDLGLFRDKIHKA